MSPNPRLPPSGYFRTEVEIALFAGLGVSVTSADGAVVMGPVRSNACIERRIYEVVREGGAGRGYALPRSSVIGLTNRQLCWLQPELPYRRLPALSETWVPGYRGRYMDMRAVDAIAGPGSIYRCDGDSSFCRRMP